MSDWTDWEAWAIEHACVVCLWRCIIGLFFIVKREMKLDDSWDHPHVNLCVSSKSNKEQRKLHYFNLAFKNLFRPRHSHMGHGLVENLPSKKFSSLPWDLMREKPKIVSFLLTSRISATLCCVNNRWVFCHWNI